MMGMMARMIVLLVDGVGCCVSLFHRFCGDKVLFCGNEKDRREAQTM